MIHMMNAEQLIQDAERRLFTETHKTLTEASPAELHNAVSGAAMDALAPVWAEKEKERFPRRQAYYLSMEYLMGRLVYNNLYCMGLLDEVRRLLAEKGVDLAALEDIEDDAFGNGGLGRLAACFLDSAVTCGVPLTGYGLRFRFGLFKQRFVDGRQQEEPDDWARLGDPWSVRRADQAVVVHMKTGDVLAVPYDMPVVGYGAKNVGTLRLWQTESLHEVDFPLFNQQEYARAAADKNRAEDLPKFLYPNDTRRAGRQLRVKQQYVLVSASIQDILRGYRQRHGSDYSRFAAEAAVQLNDTHPSMAIPELIRLLEADGVSFEEDFGIARDTFAYTNHTVMQEALEKWDLSLLNAVCPEIVKEIKKIDARFRAEAAERGLEIADDFCIIRDGRVHMAELAVYASHATNGVAALHSELLKRDLFSRWYAVWPERFQNKTNGITQRRWLGLCNPGLAKYITKRIGDGWLLNLFELEKLKEHMSSTDIREFLEVKRQNKRSLSDYVYAREGVRLPDNFVFDVQIKRMHEYKRQLMNAFAILDIYYGIKDGRIKDFPPTAFLFGAKSAPGYIIAKAVIKFINEIAKLINNDESVNDRMRVVFVQNYNCSYAEHIIPAADISEQISPAGTEASGTGNMKLMLNGAVSLCTYDGANIEILDAAGEENNYLFGARVDTLNELRPHYDPKAIYEHEPRVKRVVDTLINGTFQDGGTGVFRGLYNSLVCGNSWQKPDYYFVLYELLPYIDRKMDAIYDTQDPLTFGRKALMNTASAGYFSSDRTVLDYARDIWDLKPFPHQYTLKLF